MRTALGHTSRGGPLTTAECALVIEETFPAGYRQQVEPNLVRIEAFLTTLARLSPAEPAAASRPAAYLTCVALESAALSARTEMLAALVIQ